MLDFFRYRHAEHLVTQQLALTLTTTSSTERFRTQLNGDVKETNTSALLNADVQGHPISTHAFVVDQIEPDTEGKPIEILFGALAMKQWGIRPIPDENRLDLTYYPDVFVEY